ncbi:class C beta-lactamase-related serine hydrolase [Microbacterium protaetiae]|uniref:Class C beta-lactamase-related serine hydrolase n=1 Tax=Microbacterium protaetiae TaxID=2509458 RepID=A0A4P6EAC0_9MICO|nr:serine hydrolase [Microbacterium protaetiae]QAY59080.1 class C beta-lactamase-related serine hydrolase [Microbacterium protaetiae]
MSGALHDFTAQASAAGISLHSLEVSVEGHTMVRSGVAPFGVEVPHRLYSVSKSFTGLAILLLAQEGMLRLTDGIMQYFPEMAPVHPWLAQTRIDDMLAMTGPHSRTSYVEGAGDWLASYFRVPPTHRPGTLFTYDTSASYVLAALVERLSGTALLDYLRPRLLDPLGISGGARMLTGPEGIAHGGSGLIAAPAGMLRLAETLNGAGLWRGKRILPAAVVDRLREPRSDPGLQTWGAPFRAGYGRQLWLPGGDSWMMFGLGGQVVYGDPARALAAVVTADTTPLASGDQRLVELLLRALSVDEFGAQPHAALTLQPVTPAHRVSHARTLAGRYAAVTGERAPATLELAVDAAGGSVRTATYTLPFSISAPTITTLSLGAAVVTAGWSSPGVLDVQVSALGDDIASVRLRLVATDDEVVTVQSQGFGPAIDASWSWRGSYRA